MIKKEVVKNVHIYKVISTLTGDYEKPEHDMLRYDCAFTNNEYPDCVLYIGKFPLTMDRWRSFTQTLVEIGKCEAFDLRKWYTIDDEDNKETAQTFFERRYGRFINNPVSHAEEVIDRYEDFGV
jgi:hypothetical protein